MHRRGHVGITMLAYAPIGYLLLRERRVELALLGLFDILLVELFPENDFWIPGLQHRGTSHSLLCALVVGGVIGALGWIVGDRVVLTLAHVLANFDTATDGIFAGPFQLVADHLRALDPRTLATVGFTAGVYGVTVHLLGDVITVSGIRPFLPFSHWRLSLSSLHANKPLANNTLFGLGAAALVVVLYTTAPGIGFAPRAHDLSPVDIAAGQTQTTTNTTNPDTTVVFGNQTTNGSVVTVNRVTLSRPGFVAIHTGEYATGSAPTESSVIAVSNRLSAGTHRNVTVEIAHAPPGNPPGLNRSRLNESQTLAAVAYRDIRTVESFEW